VKKVLTPQQEAEYCEAWRIDSIAAFGRAVAWVLALAFCIVGVIAWTWAGSLPAGLGRNAAHEGVAAAWISLALLFTLLANVATTIRKK
jgi:hypothetical protein